MLDTYLYRVGCWTTGKSIKWTWGSINLESILQFCHEICCKQYLYQVVQLQRAHINSSQLCAILGAIAKYGAGKMKSLNISGTDVSKVMVMVKMMLEPTLISIWWLPWCDLFDNNDYLKGGSKASCQGCCETQRDHPYLYQSYNVHTTITIIMSIAAGLVMSKYHMSSCSLITSRLSWAGNKSQK